MISVAPGSPLSPGGPCREEALAGVKLATAAAAGPWWQPRRTTTSRINKLYRIFPDIPADSPSDRRLLGHLCLLARPENKAKHQRN